MGTEKPTIDEKLVSHIVEENGELKNELKTVTTDLDSVS